MEWNLASMERLGIISTPIKEEKEHIKKLCESSLENNLLRYEDYLIIRDLTHVSQNVFPIYPLFAILIALLEEMNNGGLCISLKKSNLQKRLSKLFENIVNTENVASDFFNSLNENKLSDFITEIQEPYLEKYSELGLTDSYKNFVLENNRQSGNSYFVTIKPLVHYVKNEESYLFLQKYFLYSIRLKDTIRQKLEFRERVPSTTDMKNSFVKAKFESRIPEIGIPFEPGLEQKLPLALFRLTRFLIISGGPGTGKTTLVKRILYRILEENPSLLETDLLLTAPTGKATQRLTESIQDGIPDTTNESAKKLKTIEAKTIHRVLGYSPHYNHFIYHKDNKLPVKVVVVDEVSMIDIILMTNLLEAIPEDATVILLGDKNQLPSVDSGAVLSDLVPSEDSLATYSEVIQKLAKTNLKLNISQTNKETTDFCDKIVILKENHREKVDNKSLKNSIFKIAEQINTIGNDKDKVQKFTSEVTTVYDLIGYQDFFDSLFAETLWNKNGVYFIDSSVYDKENSGKFFYRLCETFWDHSLLKTNYLEHLNYFSKESLDNETLNNTENALKLDRIFQVIHKNKILPVVRNGKYGVYGINSHLREYWRGKLRERTNLNFMNEELLSGLPVIITQNDYNKKLFNGDMGVILDGQNGLIAVFKKNERYISFSIDFLSSYELAFAITVHKSQGSEYDSIIIALPSGQKNKILTKEILYTGITRAKRFALVYSDKQTLETTISKRITRETGPFVPDR